MAMINGWLEDGAGNQVAPSSKAEYIEMSDPSNNSQTTNAAAVISSIYSQVQSLSGLTTMKLHTAKLGSVEQQALPVNPTDGDAYFVGVAGTYGNLVGEVGDLFIYANATEGWLVLQTNLTNAMIGLQSAVSDNLMVFSDATGKQAADSGISKTSVQTAVDVGSTLDSNKGTLAKFTEANSEPLYNGTPIARVGIPVIENNGTVPSNLVSGGLFFRKAAAAPANSGN